MTPNGQLAVRPPFLHYGVTEKVLESICRTCGKTVAFATDEKFLQIADNAHVCES
jgi:hypothetical protein